MVIKRSITFLLLLGFTCIMFALCTATGTYQNATAFDAIVAGSSIGVTFQLFIR